MKRYVLRRSESHWGGPAGEARYRRSWIPAEPGRLVVITHDLGGHSGRYERVGEWLATQGCAVHALDLRGHGRSQGERGHVEGFEDYAADLRAFLEIVRHEHPGQRVTLMGQGAGALVVTSLLCASPKPADAAVLVAPAFAMPGAPSRARRWLTRAWRRARPRARVTLDVDPHALSRDPEAVREHLEDPLVLRQVTVSLAAALESESRRLARHGPEIRVPVLIVHGDMDAVYPSRGSRTFYNRLRVPGSRLLVYPKLRHELFHEPEREQVLDDVASWVLEREPRG